jgi:hypothetical protein
MVLGQFNDGDWEAQSTLSGPQARREVSVTQRVWGGTAEAEIRFAGDYFNGVKYEKMGGQLGRI